MSLQGALSGATNKIIGASIAAAEKDKIKTNTPKQEVPKETPHKTEAVATEAKEVAKEQKSDQEVLASMGIYVDPSRINTHTPVSRTVMRPGMTVDLGKREEALQRVNDIVEHRKLSKEQSRLYMQKIRARRKKK